MKKVLLIIQREYLTRVRKRSFIVMIFVVPLLLAGMSAIVAMVASDSDKISTPQTVNVIDESHVFAGQFKNQNNIKFETGKQSLNEAKAELKDNEDLSVLLINKNY